MCKGTVDGSSESKRPKRFASLQSETIQINNVGREDGVLAGWGAHRLEIVDIVDGKILRDVEQKIVREGVEGHEQLSEVEGGGIKGWTTSIKDS